MGVETAAVIGAGALGQGLGLWQQGKDRKGAMKQYNQNRQLGQSLMQTAPGAVEGQLANFLPYITGNQASNAGQDAFMQYLRSDPSRQNSYIDQTLQGITSQADPFAPGGAYEAIGRLDARNQAMQVAGLRGSAGSLGARFGSQAAGAEAQLRGTLADTSAARNAQLAQEFTNTRLNAAGLASQRQLGLGSQYLNAAQGLSGIGQSQISQLLAALQASGQLGAARNQYNLGLYGGIAGQQPPASLGGQIGEAGTGLAALYYLMRGGGGGSPAQTTGYTGSYLPYVSNAGIY